MKCERQRGQETAHWGSKNHIIVYKGQYYDAETGLHYNWNRYYDPTLGRYLRADPLGLGGGVNSYLYTKSNPINRIDPFGLKCKLINISVDTSYDWKEKRTEGTWIYRNYWQPLPRVFNAPCWCNWYRDVRIESTAYIKIVINKDYLCEDGCGKWKPMNEKLITTGERHYSRTDRERKLTTGTMITNDASSIKGGNACACWNPNF